MKNRRWVTVLWSLGTAAAVLLLVCCSTGLLEEIEKTVSEFKEQSRELEYPKALEADTSSVVNIVLSWDAVQGATNYQLFRSESQDGPFVDIYDGPDTQYTDLGGGLTDGQTYYYRIRSTDASRQSQMSPVISVLYDSSIPTITITIPADGSYMDTGSFLAEGMAADSSGIQKVETKLDGGSWTLAAGTTNWSIDVSSLTDGLHTISARATDVDGKTNTAGSDFTVDTLHPSVVIQSPSDGANLNDRTPTISGTAADTNLDVVEYKIDDGSYAPVSGDTAWSKTLSTLSDGSYTITVRATDHAGNTTTDEIDINIDATNPSLTVTNPTVNLVTTDPTPACSGTAGDAHLDKVEVRVDSGSWQTAAGTTSWSLSPSASYGERTISIRATDTFGNSTTVQRNITVLQTPSLTSVSMNGDSQIDLDWSAVPGSGVTYHIYRSLTDSGYTELDSTTSTAYVDPHTSCSYRTTYYYRITAEKNGTETGLSGYATGYRHGFYEYDVSIGSYGSLPENLYRPTDVEHTGTLFICDSDGSAHHQIDHWVEAAPFNYQWSYGSFQSGSGSGFDRPWSIVQRSLNFYVTDHDNDEIDVWVYDFNIMGWKYDFSFALTDPWCIAADNSYLYVTAANQYVHQYDHSGGHVRTWGSYGSGNSQFINPRGIFCGGTGTVYVVDYGNDRVQYFDTDGTYLGQFPVADGSYGVCMAKGYIIVTRPFGFDMYKDGVLRSSYSHATWFSNAPRGCDSDNYDIYVVDYYGDTVRRFLLK